jgi:hypothetical protein
LYFRRIFARLNESFGQVKKTGTVNLGINQKFLRLEESRNTLIERLKSIPSGKLETSPRSDKWSVSQIFYHLNKAESLSIQYVSKKRLDVNTLKKTGIIEELKIFFLKIRFSLPAGIKAPSVLGDMPGAVDYNEIITEWNATRNKLKELIESLPDDMLYKNVFKQPALGRLNIFQMLDFMQAHFDRHRRQAEAIVEK